MRVLMLTQELNYESPVVLVAHDWAAALAKRVSRLVIGAAKVGRVDLPPNVGVISFGKESGASRLQIGLRMAVTVARLAMRRQVDMVFVHMVPKHALAALPFCTIARIPVCLWYTSHGLTAALRLCHRWVAASITASPDSYPLQGPGVVPIGHGIDTARFHPSPDPKTDPPVILLAGRLTPLKQVHLAVEAMALPPLRDHALRPVLEVAGGPFRDSDRAYFQQLHALTVAGGLEGRVKFVGAVPGDRMPALLQRATLAVACRQYPSLDKSGLEALIAGVPVVSNNPSYLPVFGRFAADLFVSGGDPVAIAGALAKLLDRPELRERIGGELRQEVIRAHGLEGFADRLTAVFDAVRRGVPPASALVPAG